MKNILILLMSIGIISSCTKEEMPLPISIKKDSVITTTTPIPKVTYKLYKESYLNGKAGIVFLWDDVNITNVYNTIMNNESVKGWYGANSYGDVNGDGYQDIIATYHTSNTHVEIRWYLNSGDNFNFTPTKTPFNQSSVGYNAIKILKTDVNNDAIADYILLGVDERIVGSYTGNFTVLIGKSNGTFDVKDLPNPNKFWFHTGAAGDLNGDGNVDVIAGTYIWYGDGTGNFINSNISLEIYTKSPLQYEILDMNGDGKNDIILGTVSSLGTTTIVLNSNDKFDNSNKIIRLSKMDYHDIIDIELYDIDTDGDLDIIECRHLGGNPSNTYDPKYGVSKLFVHINTNLSFTYIPDYIQNSEDGNWQHGNGDKNGWSAFKFEDVDKDGIDEIITESFQDGTYNGLKKVGGMWKKSILKFGK
jgi:hypothetical protein